MDTSDVCPMEDAVQALLEYLVDPLLPAKSWTNDIPSPAVKEKVAKQIRAVVLLYNYHHRRKHPHLENLNLEAFCKLATFFRPSLVPHLKLMVESKNDGVNGEQASLLERVIMDAGVICMSLDTLSDAATIEEWPIQKVVVFLVDSQRKNCYLQHSLITQGVWSLIEIPIAGTNRGSKCISGQECADNKKTAAENHQIHEVKDCEIVFEKHAFSAVVDATGVKRNDVMILERHVVHSLSKERTAARFYIMQCTSENKVLGTVPIEDVISSLQGPLFEKSCSLWTTTPVVEYFHILPFADIISDWFCRPVDLNMMKQIAAESAFADVEDNETTDVTEEVEVQVKKEFASCPASRKNVASKTTSGEPACIGVEGNERKEIAEEPKVRLTEVAPIDNPGSRKKTASKGADDGKKCDATPLVSGLSGCTGVKDNRRKEVAEEPKVQMSTEVAPIGNAERNRKIASSKSPDDGKIQDEPKVIQGFTDQREIVSQKRKTVAEESRTVIDKPDSIHAPHSTAVATPHSNLNLDKLQATIISKAKLLSETALKVLLSQKDKLILQHRNIEDEIAECDKSIRTITEGGEDDWELKLETVIERCNDLCPRSIAREATTQQAPDNLAFECNKRVKLSEPLSKSPCQELDDLCYESNWSLPTYSVSISDGGFKAEVRLKETHFMHTACGFPRPKPQEARDSAAFALLCELRSPHLLN